MWNIKLHSWNHHSKRLALSGILWKPFSSVHGGTQWSKRLQIKLFTDICCPYWVFMHVSVPFHSSQFNYENGAWILFYNCNTDKAIPIICLSVSRRVSPSGDLVDTKLPSQCYGIQPSMVRWSQRNTVVPAVIIKEFYVIPRNDASQSFLSISYVISIQPSKNHNHFF